MISFGALLHDVGKVVYRGISEKGTHSQLGARFLKNEVAPCNPSFASPEGAEVVDQVRYHHAKEMAAASLRDDSLAFITYFADNISAGMDRKNEGDEAERAYFDKQVKLRKVFNIVGGRNDDNTIGRVDYNEVRELLKKHLAQINISSSEVNSLLHLLEATCSNIPSSTNRSELVDVSLYDHAKTTAGIAACLYDYLESKGVKNYRQELFSKETSARYYDEEMFLLVSCDMSGIQDFIYTISGAGALKQLRARSLYLEIMMEHVVDELLDCLFLSRANLLYVGGGHAYLLLPNTAQTVLALEKFQRELNQWFLKHYSTDLYMGMVWQPCSANDLSNNAHDGKRFSRLFEELSKKMSQAKANRYSTADIAMLNFSKTENDAERECSECHRAQELLQDERICALCSSLGAISADLARKDVFVITASSASSDATTKVEKALILPFDCGMSVYARDEYKEQKPQAKRVYSKNTWDMGFNFATHIWMGDYAAPTLEGISAYAACGQTLMPGKGITRLGVLRADVDNLGALFASGIPDGKASISRTATLSRNVSYFFKQRINDLVKERSYQLQIIYSGGDDLFVVGNWSDVLYAAIDINKALHEFTGNDCLTISAGIGMFPDKYPIARMAAETGELEDAAKLFAKKGPNVALTTKNAIALWYENAVFSWDTFINVVEPRMREVAQVFNTCEKGKSFIYKMLDLLRTFDQVISAPRLAYLLARSFEESKEASKLARKFYDWATDEEQRRCLVAALEWYVYSIRERR